MALLKFNLFGRGMRLQVAIIVACQMAFILFGYDQGVFSGIVTNDDWKQVFNSPGSALEGIIVSIYNLGAFAGCILTFFIAEKLGRRLCMWFAMLWIIIGAALQCTSYSVPQLMVGRFVTGIGTGIETSTVPLYQSELCDAKKRGRIVSSEPLFVGLGIIISYFFDYGMRFVGGPVSWRVPIACQVIFAFAVIFLNFGLPESPRFLYAHGRNDEALEVLADVFSKTGDPNDAKVISQQTEILETLALERKTGEYKWSQIFKRDEVQTGRRILLAYGMQFMNQMGGINLVVYYVPTALETNVGMSPNRALVIGGAVQCMFFVGSLFPTFFLDKLGRRRPMMWGSFGLAISMMMLSVLLSFGRPGYSEELKNNTAKASVAFFFTYMLIFGATANCIPWVYVPEILPLHARAKGTAIGISANWLFNFLVVMISPSLISGLGWQAYFVFMALNLAFVPLVFFFYPETSGLTLEEVDYLFTKGGNGAGAFVHKTKPVEVSLKDDIEKNVPHRGSDSSAEHLETKEAGEIKE